MLNPFGTATVLLGGENELQGTQRRGGFSTKIADFFLGGA